MARPRRRFFTAPQPRTQAGGAPPIPKLERVQVAPRAEPTLVQISPDGTMAAQSRPYDTPRPVVGSAERINLDANRTNEARKASAWQTAAWSYYDQIGEVKYALNAVGQMVSRVRLYAAVVDDVSSVPVPVDQLIDSVTDEGKNPAPVLRAAAKAAKDAVDSLLLHSEGGASGLIRELALNIGVTGECYLVKTRDAWIVASIDELTNGIDGWQIKRRRDVQNSTPIPKETFVARIWRSHPRYSGEPDSSMMGVLDSCEQLVLNEQTIRQISRSRMSAGVIFVPTGVSPVSGGNLEDKLIEATTQPVEDEGSVASVTPMLITGPVDMSQHVKRIDLGRPIDESLVQIGERALDRILAGLDVPKEIVTGLSDVKYANAIVLTEDMLKSHVEPLILMIVDALTEVYLRQALIRAKVDPDLARRFCVWYDPSQITTRPDKSQAANDGYDRHIVSAASWRAARGLSELDKPTPQELIQRLAIEKAQPDPAQSMVLLESVDQEFFARARQAGQSEAGVPPDVSQILSGETPAPEGPTPAEQEQQGGEMVAPNGQQPPMPAP